MILDMVRTWFFFIIIIIIILFKNYCKDLIILINFSLETSGRNKTTSVFLKWFAEEVLFFIQF